MNRSMLVDHLGRPMASGLYQTPRSNPKAYKPRRTLHPDTRVNINAYDRWELVNYSRQLFAQVDALNAAVNQKNQWAFGDAWDYHYTGANKAWGEEAEAFINEQFFPNCNVRGPQYDFKRSMLLSGISWDVDGDDVMVLTETADGFPQLAFYPGTKIDSCMSAFAGLPWTNEVKGGPFDGARIFDGIIYDRNARPIGVRIRGDNPDQFIDISTFNADLAYEPQWADQGRGFPKIATGLLRWMDIQDIDDFIRRAVKLCSSISIIEKNEMGEGVNEGGDDDEENPNANPLNPDGPKIGVEEIGNGEYRFLNSLTGEALETLNNQNPHPNTEAFVERTLRGSLASIGWYIELLNLGTTSRAPTRVLAKLANQSIWSRQTTGMRRWKRAVVYAIGKGMKSGYLSRNDDGHDAYKMEPGLPAPMTVDEGNDQMADREALKLGMTNKAILAQKNHGLHYRAIDDQREAELAETYERAARLAAKFPQLTFDRHLELLEQRSPNPVAQSPKTKDPTQKSQEQPPK